MRRAPRLEPEGAHPSRKTVRGASALRDRCGDGRLFQFSGIEAWAARAARPAGAARHAGRHAEAGSRSGARHGAARNTAQPISPLANGPASVLAPPPSALSPVRQARGARPRHAAGRAGATNRG
ncbi:hypothetical protein EFP19_24650 [Burkholderia glumae]|nr:hypothetical protein EFP19_24650 [Burkholderia glumae]